MKGLAICNKGIEDVAAKEVEEITDEVAFVEDSAVVFDTNAEKLAKLTYLGKSIKRTMVLLGRAKINNKFDDVLPLIVQLVEELKTEEWLEKKSFKVVCERIGDHDFASQQIAETVGELLFKKHKTKVVMNNPERIIYVFVNENSLYIGVDFAGMNLSKREYKIFSIGSSLNGALGYALLRIAKVKKKDIILDPFCNSGIIPIEAASYMKNMSPNFYRKDKLLFTRFLKIDPKKFDDFKEVKGKIIAYDKLMNFMQATKKNAQIAGVNKNIIISKVDIEWLDTKLDQNQIDKIVTRLPELSKTTNEGDIEKLYKEFFYQLDYILDEAGLMVAIMEKTDFLKTCFKRNEAMQKFKIAEERDIMQGKKNMKVVIIKRA
ncbi:hypothetical protein HN695_03090 [Candidatus Woesearchaeota archaeon]|jgi:putative N6-adenine-specific DNA methylase|nr:hypothetical protein [Candidatus Woesearchaeota archaeon]MBT5271762.1 hypothetical protein [Candidatus Woesearchaeota archaeon]MBT6336318.1 hypothetical protein [Candidatus Woesearchaeota archaeon]MBT7927296.1 hypothetical protein [Candidatus Woesearchaeota archaeon]